MDPSLHFHLACKSCSELPKGGRVYSCTEGHLICDPCFDGLVPTAEPPKRRRAKLCPVGRCPFAKPPFRNRTVENILADIVFPCEQSDNGCEFRGNWADVQKHHDSSCKFRLVDCPEAKCEEKLLMFGMAEHLKTAHGVKTTDWSAAQQQRWALKPKQQLGDCFATWRLSLLLKLKGKEEEEVGLICMITRGDKCYFWISLFAEEEDVEKYSCRVVVRHRDGVTKYSFEGKCQSVRGEGLLKEERCLALPKSVVMQCVEDEVVVGDDDEDNEGVATLMVEYVLKEVSKPQGVET